MQVNSSVLREVCSVFGTLKVCYTHQQSECSLLCYSSIEEAVQAKTVLDKNPMVNGVPVTVQFASESTIKEICENLQLRLDAEQHEDSTEQQTWGFTASSQANQNLPNSATLPNISFSAPSQWDSPAQAPVPSSMDNNNNSNSGTISSGGGNSSFTRQTSELSTPGSSVWSDGGFLSGFSSPWQSGFSSGAGSAGNSMNASNNSGSFSLASPHQNSADSSSLSTVSNNNATGQPFLPNGLF